MGKKLRLYLSIIFSMVIWSFSFIWTRMAIVMFSPMTLITLRLVLASLILYVFVKARGQFQLVRKKDLPAFLLLALFEPYIYYIGETFGLTMVDSTMASVIVSTIPLFAPVFAFFLLGERLSVINLLGIVVSLAGVYLVIQAPGTGRAVEPLGVGLMFVAVLAAICYSVVLRRIPAYYHTLNVILYQSVFSLILFIPTVWFTERGAFVSGFHLQSVMALWMLALFASSIAFVLFGWAVREMGLGRTNVFINLIPVFTALFSWLLLGDRVTGFMCTGIAVVIIGLFISQSVGLQILRRTLTLLLRRK